MSSTTTDLRQARVELVARLHQRRPEIENSILTRVHALAETSETADPEYTEGLRAAVQAAVDFGIDAIEGGEESTPPIPAALQAQARLAARSGVSLDTVLRRYVAGFTVFGDFLIGEAEAMGLPQGPGLQGMLATEAAQLDRLIPAVSDEYSREREHHFRSPAQRQVERVKKLLAGEPVDAGKLGYDLDTWHIAVIAVGEGSERALRGLAEALDRRLLVVDPGGEGAWAWLGGRRYMTADALVERARENWPATATLAVGEPGQEIAGWRFSHRQAKAALLVARHRGKAIAGYRDVCLLASALRDDLLAVSLRRLYLAPLEQARDGGKMARETLRAYFAANCNVSSTATALGVHRDTVAGRLRAIEATIGRTLASSSAELKVALGLDEIPVWPVFQH